MVSTKFTLGFYGSNPSATDPTANLQFQTDYNAYVALMGARPVTMDAFVDSTQAQSTWVSNAQFTAYSWAQTGAAYVGPTSGTIPVIGVPMSSAASNWSDIDTVLKAIVAGTYDSVYQGIVDAWADQGYKTIDLRLGYEFDGNYMAWGTGNSASPTIVADFVAAWQHLANLVHQEGQMDGITVNTVWNPTTSAWTNQSVTAEYPGNQYVDIIGTDIYSPVYAPALNDWSASNPAALSGTTSSSTTAWAANTANRIHYWDYSNANQWNPTGQSYTGWSIQEAVELAEATGKPLGIAETGAGGNGTTTGPVDDSAFPAWLAAELSQPGGPKISFVNIWTDNESDGNWGFLYGQKPGEAAAWAANFGATSSTVPNGSAIASAPITLPANSAATTIGSGSDSLTLQMSEDAYLGNAQFTVSVNGVQVGGVQTVTAAHGSAEQTFVILGNWGTGAQKVTITFLNDAWGGSSGMDRNLYVDQESYDGVNTYFPLALASNGAQSVTVGVAGLPQVTFTDDKGKSLTQAIITSGSSSTYANILDGNVYQWMQGSVNWLSTASFAQQVLSATVTDATGRSFGLSNIETANIGLSGATAGTLTVQNVAGGYIRLSNGNYTAAITVMANCGATNTAINTLNLSLGSGNDNITIDANKGYGLTQANIVSSAGTHTLNFIYPGSVDYVGEGGVDNITVLGGANQFHAGNGALTIAATGGKNAYYFAPGATIMTIQDFSAAQGDTLWVDSRMKAGMIASDDGHGGTMLNISVSTVGIDLANVKYGTFNPAIIHWT